MTITITNQNNNKTHWNENQLKIIKDMYARGLNSDELHVFSLLCKELGLDPIRKQAYGVKRKMKNINGIYEIVLTLQTSIEGYRAIAERTGNYAPGEESIYLYDDNKNLIGAKAYVKKRTQDGTWHNVSAEAYLEEYAARDKQGNLTQFWSKFPRVMIEKCAEARALRRCFPNELGSLYIKEEMDQANEDTETIVVEKCVEEKKSTLTPEQVQYINTLVKNPKNITKILQKQGVNSLLQIKQENYKDLIDSIEQAINTKKSKEITND